MDMVSRETSAQVAGKMMEALYEQMAAVIESLLSTQFDNQRISKTFQSQLLIRLVMQMM